MAKGTVLWVNAHAVSPRDGGGTRHYEMARALAPLGWEVTVAASDFHLQSRRYTRRVGPRDRRAIDETEGGVRFRWLWTAPYRGNDWRRMANWWSFAREVERLPATMTRPSLVIGSSPHLLAAVAAARAARAWRVPFWLEVRDLWPESLAAVTGRRGALYFGLRPVASWLYRHASRIIVLTAGVRSWLLDRGVSADKVVLLPNGVDPGAFPDRPAGPDDDRLVVGYLGAHGYANGLEVVLEAAALLAGDPRIRFRLIGDGPAKAALVRRAAEHRLGNVEFVDAVPKREVPELLSTLHVGLMVLKETKLFEFGVSPNKLFDYFAAGLPVVTNVRGEVGDLVTRIGAGEVAADGSPEALGAAIRALASRPVEQRRAAGQRGRAWTLAERSRDALGIQLDRALEGALSR
jgi:glycosyltransferase involved in cell wall biosynthesis